MKSRKDKKITVITGSSNKYGAEIYAVANFHRNNGEFIIDDSQYHLLPENIGRKEFIKRILDCDKLLVYNKNGYIGFHTKLEIMIAEVIGVKIQYLFNKNKSIEGKNERSCN